MLRRFTAKIFIGYLCILLLAQLFSGCMSFRMNDEDLNEYFAGHTIPKQHTIRVSDKNINYAEIGNDSLPVAFFVHGSPGSWSAFADFMKDSILLQKVKMVSVDRIGFGYSDFGHAEKSLAKQAAYLKPIVARYKAQGKKIILIGHSLGGPVIARMAIDYPELIDNLVFVAGSIDPTLEPSRWYRYILDFAGVRYMIPKSFRASNYEILCLKEELEEMLPLWQNIKQPCIVIQGNKDVLVHPQNAAFAKRMLVNAESVEMWLKDDMNHFVPWSNPELINQAILKSIER
ncbi:alpha/beta fold hydrolase [Emticicia sp. BO119]|uniref:alpha/beta fold hydrolase n=1 Tax=Emticicia sp. BO119 TaxID=2757768 RepID=UPI0015EFF77E|nr:alpha/beta hydrolase [Emticicia sp. BO119]MBA4851805.1 alpha/beta hydrolase [Emticicia sp. BO119]